MPLSVKTTLYILQHPFEETRNLKTAPMLTLGLPPDKCIVLKGKRFSQEKYPELHAIVEQPNTLLVYPTPDSEDIQRLHGTGNDSIVDQSDRRSTGHQSLTQQPASRSPLYHLLILREHLGSLVFQLDPAGWHLASGFGTVSKELLPSFLSLRRAHHDGLLEAVLPWG